MAQISRPWDGSALGDCGEYDSNEWDDIWATLFTTDTTIEGVLWDFGGELAVTNPTGLNIQVQDGGAFCLGKFYQNTTPKTLTVTKPIINTRIDRVVLQALWSTYQVRLKIIVGVEGGAAPALTQNDGVKWEIPIAQISITTSSVVTLTDERTFINMPTEILASDVVGGIIPGGYLPLVKRKGGDSADWDVVGASTYDGPLARVTVGVFVYGETPVGSETTWHVDFPETFSGVPIVLPINASWGYAITVANATASDCDLIAKKVNASPPSLTIYALIIGPQ